MSDPFRDGMVRQRNERAKKVREEYEEITVWVKTDHTRQVKDYIIHQLLHAPGVEAATTSPQYPETNELGK